jgi:tol-pal system protein YbgF
MPPIRRRLACLVLGLASLVPLGCAGGKDASEKQLDELRNEITKIQHDQDHLMERIEGLETSRPQGAGAGAGAAPSSSREERPALKVVVLHPDDPPTGGPEDAAAEPEDEGPRPTVRARGRGDIGEAASGARAKGDGKNKAFEAQKDYEDGLSLVKKKQYNRAVEALTGFLVRYPDHAHADNATFWMGEAYLGMGDTARAMEQFEAVLARFPKGNKAPDALLKIALVSRKQGDDARAKSAVAKLKSDYPNSDAAKRAPKE